MLLALLFPSALGATLVVDASGGGSYTTISSAIGASTSGDTLSIRAGTYAEALDTRGRSLVLQGAGSGSVFVTGGTDEQLNIDQGETVTVRGITFRGSAQGAELRGATVTFEDVIFTGHSGVVSGGAVGAFGGSTVTMTNCELNDNTVTGSFNGGALYIDGSDVTLDTVVISGNSASQGGGVYVYDATLVMTDVTIEDNVATTHGGGLRVRNGSTLTATRATIQGNTATGRGGGASFRDSDGTWTASALEDNSAGTAGGALHLDGMQSSGTTLDATVVSNTAGGSAAGIFLNGHDLSFEGDLSDNTGGAAEDGGALYAVGSDVRFTDATVSGHTALDGGALRLISGSTLTLLRADFTDNTATGDGGAISLEGALVADDSDFNDNIAGASGGAIRVEGASATFSGCEFADNEAGAAAGGGALIVSQGAMSATSTRFAGNQAGYGGGLAVLGSGGEAVDILSCSFGTNAADALGGGVFLSDVGATVIGGTIFTNSSAGSAGGALVVDSATSLNLRWSTFLTNTAPIGAATLLSGLGGGTSKHLVVAGNVGDTSGGSHYSDPDGRHPIINSRFYENVGAGLVVRNDTHGWLPVSNVDVSGNDGDGLVIEQSPLADVTNVIAALNTSVGFRADTSSAGGMALEWSDAWGNGTNWGGALPNMSGVDGNMSADPEYSALVVDGATGGDLLLLTSTSPCRDAGDPALLDPDGTTSDMGSYGGPGASDADMDGDGVSTADGDCDDGDPSAHPGADETWYDGVDQDCEGGNDWDADVDGYESPFAEGGDDCDDHDAGVHPGADDDTVDGTDQNCDGTDGPVGGDDTGGDDGGDDGGEDDETDADRDGWSAAEDCNDAEPLANPGMNERCADGIDNDCDDFTDDLDADCIGKDSGGCATVAPPGGRASRIALAGLALLVALSGRRRRWPRPSSSR
jgi:predicted outer membrane repeat protein